MVIVDILLGILVVLLLTAATGYFVAQEFGFMAVDRSRLKARAATGDRSAQRALDITGRTSFMLSGAQLGITATGLTVGYVAEPLIGAGIGRILGGAGVSQGTGIAIGAALALLLSTLLQMVFGELFPKNLAIAKPESVARWLAWSTGIYLTAFGWLIWLFDHASNLLLKAVRIAPVRDVEHAATPRDLEHIVAESRDAGDLPAELSMLLDRVLDLQGRSAAHAMIARPQVMTVSGEQPVSQVTTLMAAGYSRLPVVAGSVDDVVGVIGLRDVLKLDSEAARTLQARDVARPALLVPASLPLPQVLGKLRDAGEELACVVDEYGGLAGIITTEDIAEELVGEVTDEHDAQREQEVRREGNGWLLPGTTHIDEVERLLACDLPSGPYQTIAGLALARMGRLPRPGDSVTVDLPRSSAAADGEPERQITVTVRTVHRRVPGTVRLDLHPPDGGGE